jgi:hypothetical protein
LNPPCDTRNRSPIWGERLPSGGSPMGAAQRPLCRLERPTLSSRRCRGMLTGASSPPVRPTVRHQSPPRSRLPLRQAIDSAAMKARASSCWRRVRFVKPSGCGRACLIRSSSKIAHDRGKRRRYSKSKRVSFVPSISVIHRIQYRACLSRSRVTRRLFRIMKPGAGAGRACVGRLADRKR